MAFYGVAKRIVQVALWPFYKVEAEYRAELPQDKGYIMASNHVSDMDPVMLGLAFHKQLRFMAKEELFKIPVLGGIIRALGAFPVARGKGDQTAIQNAVKVVEDGGVLGIFPEGTRFKDGKLHRLKSGAVVVASKTGADLLPACIQYEKRRFLRKHVKVTFGIPIENSAFGLTGQSKTELRAANKLLAEGIAGLLGVEAP